jgi:peptide chain release factor
VVWESDIESGGGCDMFSTEIDDLKREVNVETYRSSGPGGQRKNKTETAVRLRHLPSGLTVVATEHRSQALNLKRAFERLRERLVKLNRPRKRRIPTSVSPASRERRIQDKKILSRKKKVRREPLPE